MPAVHGNQLTSIFHFQSLTEQAEEADWLLCAATPDFVCSKFHKFPSLSLGLLTNFNSCSNASSNLKEYCQSSFGYTSPVDQRNVVRSAPL